MSADTTAPAADYRDTLFLPQTDFPMRAGLPNREPGWLDRWAQLRVYDRLRKQTGREPFILHDGPPYANGHLHIGHALNKILKDMVVRSQQMMGRDSRYVPGWDCHGLPIEWKIEEQYRAKGLDKDAVGVVDFRQECRRFAEGWIDVQRDEFKRLGVTGAWDRPYLTMDFHAERVIAEEFMKFLMTGTLYQGSKPVMWSPVEKTALAEAEVEYHDHVSPTIWVRFPVTGASSFAEKDACIETDLLQSSVVIWTTTPWTIPQNRAVAFNPDLSYGLYRVTGAPEDNWVKPGETLLLADKLAAAVLSQARVESHERVRGVTSAELQALTTAHPFRNADGAAAEWDYDVPLLPGDHVTDDAGTGFVHTAPSHGDDDYQIGVRFKLPMTHNVLEDGSFRPDLPFFGGKVIVKPNGKEGDANEAVIKKLQDAGALAARGKLTHSYPHSWRSKAPVIFRNTPQWFAAIDRPVGDGQDQHGETIRDRALTSIDRLVAWGEDPAKRVIDKARAGDWIEFEFSGYRQSESGFRSIDDELPLVSIEEADPAAMWPTYQGLRLFVRLGGDAHQGVGRRILLFTDRHDDLWIYVPENFAGELYETDKKYVIASGDVSKIEQLVGLKLKKHNNGRVDERLTFSADGLPGRFFIELMHQKAELTPEGLWLEIVSGGNASGNRLYSMVQNRPDWVLSRQRAWGVPLTCFVKKGAKPHDPDFLLRNPAVNARIAEAFEAEGADAWYRDGAKERFLGNDHNPEEYEQVFDILDVWFDSGSTHAFVLRDREDGTPDGIADLYLEGTDQHRGWFQSSLLQACGTMGRAPYRGVLTHGFTLDEKGLKMSKSIGNTIEPEKVVKQYGADILRLWTAQSDYTADQRIGDEILKGTADSYRRLRNTMRFLLGNLAGWDEAERVDPEEMPELERWVLHRLAELDAQVRKGYAAYDFQGVWRAVFEFATVELSAFYFDIRKDALYCDPADAPRRRAARTVLDLLFHRLTTWLAPILVFTMEEVWLERFPSDDSSVHLVDIPATPADWLDDGLASKWARIRAVRRVVTAALELQRRDKVIGASLEAAPVVHVEDGKTLAALKTVHFEDICITSAITLSGDPLPSEAFRLPEVPDVGVLFERAEGEKCERCWKILPDVGTHTHPGVCARCDAALG